MALGLDILGGGTSTICRFSKKIFLDKLVDMNLVYQDTIFSPISNKKVNYNMLQDSTQEHLIELCLLIGTLEFADKDENINFEKTSTRC